MAAQWHKPLRRLRSFLNWRLLDDRQYVERRFRMALGRDLDLDNPRSFNEKTQWIKLYYRRPDMARVADKFAARSYVQERIGAGFQAGLLGVFDDMAALRTALPLLPPRFVLKATHGCTWNLFVRDKARLSATDLKRVAVWLKLNYYHLTREWAYDDVPPRLIAEAFLEPAGGAQQMIEYEVYCFHGEPQVFRFQVFDGTRPARKTYDRDWNEIPVASNRPIYPHDLPQPRHYEQMMEISRALSAGWPMLRVDFYETDDLTVGELTCYPGGGFTPYDPARYDFEIGRFLDLSVVPVLNPYTPRGWLLL